MNEAEVGDELPMLHRTPVDVERREETSRQALSSNRLNAYGMRIWETKSPAMYAIVPLNDLHMYEVMFRCPAFHREKYTSPERGARKVIFGDGTSGVKLRRRT